jgi:hypothetical protein
MNVVIAVASCVLMVMVATGIYNLQWCPGVRTPLVFTRDKTVGTIFLERHRVEPASSRVHQIP